MTEEQVRVYHNYSGLQTKLGNKDACHFLVLCSIIHEYRKREVDILRLAHTSIEKGWMRNDYYVKDALAILNFATGQEWNLTYYKREPTFEESKYGYIEEVWYNNRTHYTHYKRNYFDTLTYSVTVAEGACKEWRIYDCR